MKTLSSDHPSMKKLEKLMNYAEELGLNFDFTLHDKTIMSDTDQPNKEFLLTDFESEDALREFPYHFNFKVSEL